MLHVRNVWLECGEINRNRTFNLTLMFIEMYHEIDFINVEIDFIEFDNDFKLIEIVFR